MSVLELTIVLLAAAVAVMRTAPVGVAVGMLSDVAASPLLFVATCTGLTLPAVVVNVTVRLLALLPSRPAWTFSALLNVPLSKTFAWALVMKLKLTMPDGGGGAGVVGAVDFSVPPPQPAKAAVKASRDAMCDVVCMVVMRRKVDSRGVAFMLLL